MHARKGITTTGVVFFFQWVNHELNNSMPNGCMTTSIFKLRQSKSVIFTLIIEHLRASDSFYDVCTLIANNIDNIIHYLHFRAQIVLHFHYTATFHQSACGQCSKKSRNFCSQSHRTVRQFFFADVHF